MAERVVTDEMVDEAHSAYMNGFSRPLSERLRSAVEAALKAQEEQSRLPRVGERYYIPVEVRPGEGYGDGSRPPYGPRLSDLDGDRLVYVGHDRRGNDYREEFLTRLSWMVPASEVDV